MWQGWTNAILGIILLAMAFIGQGGSAFSWTMGIIGALVAIVGFMDTANEKWEGWTNGILGIVVFVAAFLHLSGSAFTWTLGILGIIIAIVGFIEASKSSHSGGMSHA